MRSRRWGAAAAAVALGFLGVGNTAAAAAAPAWRVVGVPTPPGVQAQELLGVSCPSTSFCLAVGSKQAGERLIAESRKGTRWTRLAPPMPANAIRAVFAAVDCRTDVSCTAVGYELVKSVGRVPLAEHWNGRSWRIEAVPFHVGPRGQVSGAGQFTSISCPTASTCVAVGYSETPERTDQEWLADSWNAGGSGWSTDDGNIGNQATVEEFAGVSCSSATACYGVGTVDWADGGPSEDQNLITPYYRDIWQGGPSSASADDETHLNAVSCPDDGYQCVAVGQYDGSGTSSEFGLVDGQVVAAATPGGDKFVDLESLSCRTVTSCTAVGTAGPSSATARPVAESWNGKAWSLQSTQAPSGSVLSRLSSVSCPTTSECVAVGSRQSSARAPSRLLVEEKG